MQVIPVLDIQNGVVVQGIAGQRDRYQPIRSILTASRDPSVVLRAIYDEFGLDRFYIADLDAIEGRSPNRCTLAELSQLPFTLMVDGGVSDQEGAEELFDLGIDEVVIALETLPDAESAASIVSSLPTEKLWFSLDLKNGKPFCQKPLWQDDDPLTLAKIFADLGYANFIVLDLISVGAGAGLTTLELCRQIRSNFSNTQVVTGGGVSSIEDVSHAHDKGLDGLLVASAIHSGALTSTEMKSVWNSPTSPQ